MKIQAYAKTMTLGILLLSVIACTNNSTSADMASDSRDNSTNHNNKKGMKYSKKYVNADFYIDGEFNEEAAIKAYKDMFEFYDIPFTPFLEENFWVAEF